MLVYISTDAGSDVEPVEFESVAEALEATDGVPPWVRSEIAFERWLERRDGYGFIEVDGVVVANVSP